MPARMYAVGALLAALLPAVAGAWPVDRVIPLETGKEQFQKLAAVDWVEVEDASVVTAEVLSGSNELLLTGQKPGRTLLLLYAEGRFAVWALTVGAVAPPGDASSRMEPARKACPGLKATEGAERMLSATVKDDACRLALREMLKSDAYVAKELELTFEVSALQAQLADVVAGLTPLGLEARYSGAGLVLSGTATVETHHRALWELFRRSVGRVPLEDRVEVQVPEAAPDAGPSEAELEARRGVRIEEVKPDGGLPAPAAAPAPKKPPRRR